MANLFHQQNTNDLLDQHHLSLSILPIEARRGGDSRPSLVPGFDHTRSGDFDFFVHGYSAVPRRADLSEGLIIQFTVDREHKDVLDRCHSLDVWWSTNANRINLPR